MAIEQEKIECIDGQCEMIIFEWFRLLKIDVILMKPPQLLGCLLTFTLFDSLHSN